MVGIICPCRGEAGPFLEALQNKEKRVISKIEFDVGDLQGKETVIAACGVGKVNGALAAAVMIENFHVEKIIVSGTAGALDESLEPGDTIICTQTLYHDFRNGNLCEESPYMDEAVFAATEGECEVVAEHLHYGRIVTGDRFVEGEKRRILSEKYGALCADMETAGIAHCCYMYDVPFQAVRTVTDTIREDGLAACLNNFSMAACRSAEVVFEILRG